LTANDLPLPRSASGTSATLMIGLSLIFARH
jgi:hypothetical protein